MLRKWRTYKPRIKTMSGCGTGVDSRLGLQPSQPEFVEQDATMKYDFGPSTPTVSMFSGYTAETILSQNEPISLPPNHIFHLAESEKQLVLRFREHAATTGFQVPLPREDIQTMLETVMEQLDDGFESFLASSSRTSILNSNV